MNIEFNQILTFVSVVAAVYFAFKSNSRANNDEVSKKAQVDAILSQKLDSISDDTKEIRKEITDVKVKVNDLSERVVMVEQSTNPHTTDLTDTRKKKSTTISQENDGGYERGDTR